MRLKDILLSSLLVLVFLVLLIWGALDESNYAQGRAWAALTILALLPLIFYASAFADVAKIRKEKKVSWREAFSLLNKPQRKKKRQ